MNEVDERGFGGYGFGVLPWGGVETWTPVNENQGANWAPVNELQTPVWTPVNDTQ